MDQAATDSSFIAWMGYEAAPLPAMSHMCLLALHSSSSMIDRLIICNHLSFEHACGLMHVGAKVKLAGDNLILVGYMHMLELRY